MKYIGIIIIGLAFLGCEEPNKSQKNKTPPTVNIVSPSDSSVIYGIVPIICKVIDSDNASSIDLWVNDDSTGVVVYSEPYELEWRTTLYLDGSTYEIKVKVYDNESIAVDSDSIVLRIDQSKYWKIAFSSTRNEGGYGPDIFIMNVDGSDVVQLTNTGSHSYSIPYDFSPDGQRILYVSDKDYDYWGDIYSVDIHGSNDHRITNRSGLDYMPRYSHDGQHVISVHNHIEDSAMIYLDSNKLTEASDNAGNRISSHHPRFLPDDSRIVYQMNYLGRRYIYIMDRNGDNKTQLGSQQGWYQGWYPDISPDGIRIVFASRNDDLFRINIMDIDGSNVNTIFESEEGVGDPIFSPDCCKILFSNGDWVRIIGIDGNNLIQLSEFGCNPTFSPDGTKIMFESDGEIYVMNSDGSSLNNITNNPANDSYPVFRR